MTARVQAGVVVGDLQKAVENFGLYYPPDPSNLAVSTIGGSIAQASAGARRSNTVQQRIMFLI